MRIEVDLPAICQLIEDGGSISIGPVDEIECVAAANDESRSLALLRRRPGESLGALLKRLDAAIVEAADTEEGIDEVNTPPTNAKRAARRRSGR